MQKSTKRSILALFVCLVFGGVSMFAATAKTVDKDTDQTLRATSGLFDQQYNKVSNIEFAITNYGIWGLNVKRNEASGRWPRGSANSYIFGGGVWFGTQKNKPGTDEIKNYVEVSYNPNSGKSWMVPGRISDGDRAITTPASITKYRTYFSIDFNPATGKPLTANEGQSWPIWDASADPNALLKYDRYFGYYIDDETMRNKATYPKGPAMISGEDIFCTFKDTDLGYYEGGEAQRKTEGYPLRLQFDQMVYSWGYGKYKDFIFMVYNIYNSSSDTLRKCWMAPVLDVDIAIASNTQAGAGNDQTSFNLNDPSLNLAFQWSGSNQGEKDKGFGYLGFDFLESPAVFQAKDTIENIVTKKTLKSIDTTIDINDNFVYDTTWEYTQVVETEIRFIDSSENGYVRKDKPYYPNAEQLGLVTCNNWAIKDDKIADDDRYNFMAKGVKDGAGGDVGDKRFMMATGPFNMRPKDTVRIVVGVMLSAGSKGTDCDGTQEDLVALVELDKFAQSVYDSNFRAPAPPDRTVFGTKWTPLNNGVKIEWDSTAEMSADSYEKGLDFMGYNLYRAKETKNDAGKDYTWKLLKTWQIRTPFVKSGLKPISDGETSSMPYLDAMRIVGPVTDANGNITDSMAVKVMRVGTGMTFYDSTYTKGMEAVSSSLLPAKFRKGYYPIISEPDTSYFARPWGNYFAKYANATPYIYRSQFVYSGGVNVDAAFTMRWYDPDKKDPLFDSVLIGVVKLNRAQLKYNPLFYKRKTINRNDTTGMKDDGIVYKIVNGSLTTTVDSVYFKKSFRKVEGNGTSTGVIDVLVPFNLNNLFADAQQIYEANDTVTAYIRRRYATAVFPEFEQTENIRANVIAPYMKSITNNYSYVDIGDDDGDNKVNLSENVLKTEKLINNMPYYYKMLAFDEGDYQQPTPTKENDASEGLVNLVETYPREGVVAATPTFEILSEDTNLLGGMYNFKFYALDNERVNALFGDDVFELKFAPHWYAYNVDIDQDTSIKVEADKKIQFGLYGRRITITNTRNGDVVYDGNTNLETTPCESSIRELFTERAASYVWSSKIVTDTITNVVKTFGNDKSTESVMRSGRFSSGDYQTSGYCYAPNWSNIAAGTMAFDFDFTVRQYGGIYRPDTTSVITAKGDGVTAVTPINILGDVRRTVPLGINPEYNSDNIIVYGSFNNGPGTYKIEFLPGGEETVDLAYGAKNKTTTTKFNLKYLNLKVTNVIEHKRPNTESKGDSILVTYPNVMPHIAIAGVTDLRGITSGIGFVNPLNTTTEVLRYSSNVPDPQNLFLLGQNTNDYIGKYNIHAYGWVNVRNQFSTTKYQNHVVRSINPDLRGVDDTYSGLQGRYYLTGESEEINPKTLTKDVIDFTHVIDIAGVKFSFDYANKGRTNSFKGSEWAIADTSTYVYGEDFKAGDVITLKTIGGALGLPLPGATVRFRVNKTDKNDRKMTDGLLDKVNIVPNPYYVSHIGQKSPYDAKIYFTKLPKVAKIEIYTITGDLIYTINHNETTSEETDKASVEVWDLLSKNGQRVASQTMAAVITTPDGAQTIKNFTVVVGSSRVIED